MSKVRLPILTAVVVLSVIAWSWRPPTPISGRAPTLLVPPKDSAQVTALMDSLFSELGAAIDTVRLDAAQLTLSLYPGTFTRPMRLVHGSCISEGIPPAAMRHAAVMAYRMYGLDRHVERIEVRVTAADSTLTGGWGYRQRCGPGRGMLAFFRPELDSVTVEGARGR